MNASRHEASARSISLKSAAQPIAPSRHQASVRSIRIVGLTSLFLFGGGFLVWASTASLSGAVIAQGQIVVDSTVRRVQHPTGGFVAEVLVREGTEVKAGDLLVRLDDTMHKASHGIITGQLDQLEARRARLEAERDGAAWLTFDPSLVERAFLPAVARLMEIERGLFASRRAARETQVEQLKERIAQLSEEREGLSGLKRSKARESALIVRELEGVRMLLQNNLVTMQRASALEREAVSLDGAQQQLAAQIAQTGSRIAEARLAVVQVDDNLRSEVMRELTETQGRLSELKDRQTATADLLRRVELRAPVDGVVQRLAVHAPGDVVTQSEPVLMLVPSREKLFIEARVATADYDQLHLGQRTLVKVHAGNQRTMPDLNGEVVRLGADAQTPNAQIAPFYLVRVNLDAGEAERLAPVRLTSGMTADVFIQTATHTPAQYLIKPLTDQFARAFRER
jgi:HlyD family secretion protein